MHLVAVQLLSRGQRAAPPAGPATAALSARRRRSCLAGLLPAGLLPAGPPAGPPAGLSAGLPAGLSAGLPRPHSSQNPGVVEPAPVRQSAASLLSVCCQCQSAASLLPKCCQSALSLLPVCSQSAVPPSASIVCGCVRDREIEQGSGRCDCFCRSREENEKMGHGNVRTLGAARSPSEPAAPPSPKPVWAAGARRRH